MVVDTSAILAILQDEPEKGLFLDLLTASVDRLVSSANAVELSMVVLSRRGEPGLEIKRDVLERLQIQTAPLMPDHVDLAVDAFRRYGKGRHKAALNLGDCFSYALAKATGEPLLFKGNDFAHTDIARAVPSP